MNRDRSVLWELPERIGYWWDDWTLSRPRLHLAVMIAAAPFIVVICFAGWLLLGLIALTLIRLLFGVPLWP